MTSSTSRRSRTRKSRTRRPRTIPKPTSRGVPRARRRLAEAARGMLSISGSRAWLQRTRSHRATNSSGIERRLAHVGRRLEPVALANPFERRCERLVTRDLDRHPSVPTDMTCATYPRQQLDDLTFLRAQLHRDVDAIGVLRHPCEQLVRPDFEHRKTPRCIFVCQWKRQRKCANTVRICIIVLHHVVCFMLERGKCSL
jgi:hypothetical protein